MQLMFETFGVNALYIEDPCMLSLYATGRTTGIVMESGDGVTQFTPIYEGFGFPEAIVRIDLAGSDLTDYLIILFQERGNPLYNLTNTNNRETARDIKEKLCYVSTGYERDLSNGILPLSEGEQTYQLPDTNIITICKERFMCPEILFQPSLIGMELNGIHKFMYNSIMKCSIDCRKQFYGNVLLSGGCTMFPGLEERMRNELAVLAPRSTKIKIITPGHWKYPVWFGGSQFASLPIFHHLKHQKSQYDEIGSTPKVKKRIY